MKIQYIGCHAVLEYDEVKLFTEMGHEVYCNGGYRDPRGSFTLPRPGIPNAPFDEKFFNLTAQYPKTALPPELIDPYDLIIIMHTPEVVTENWEKIKHKPVIWRSIGQSDEGVENKIRKARYEGMKIVRYSPKENNIPGFVGSDALIRFYKEQEEFGKYNGKEERVINFSQSLKGRRIDCHYDDLFKLLDGFPALVYGSGNEDLGGLNGGELPYDLMKGALRDNRVFAYAGTWPACYTLTFVEALMTGIPIVAFGKKTAEHLPDNRPVLDFYEVADIIKHNENGFISDNIYELKDIINSLLKDQKLAESIGAKGRLTALELFDKEKIKKQWEEFFKKI
jgi:hypothetical protein